MEATPKAGCLASDQVLFSMWAWPKVRESHGPDLMPAALQHPKYRAGLPVEPVDGAHYLCL